MTPIQSRVEALRDLVELRRPVVSALSRLSDFEWASNEDLVTMTVDDLVRALDGFRAGSIDEVALCDWAETLQGREDVGLDASARDLLADALFQLSTPELCGDAAEVVGTIKQRLS